MDEWEGDSFGEIRIPLPERPIPDRDAPKGTLFQFTLDFLKDLKDNNDREWFKINENRYKAAKDNITDCLSIIYPKLAIMDNSILQNGKPKDFFYRINRDLRFGADRSPYKTYIAVGFTKTGHNDSIGYYFHVNSNEVFVGAGMACPSSDELRSLRHNLVQDSSELDRFLQSELVIQEFGVDSLIKCSQKNSLKSAPKGYKKDHEKINTLRLKCWIVGKTFSDKEILGDCEFSEKVLRCFEILHPLVALLNTWITD